MKVSFEKMRRKCMGKDYHFTRKYRYWVDWNKEGAPLHRVELAYLGTTEYYNHVEEVYKP